MNSAGAWAASIAARFGEAEPLAPIAPNCMVTEPVPAFIMRSLGICGGGVAIRRTAQGSVVIGGGESHVHMNEGRVRPLAAVCAAVLRRAIRAVPRLARAGAARLGRRSEGEGWMAISRRGAIMFSENRSHAYERNLLTATAHLTTLRMSRLVRGSA